MEAFEASAAPSRLGMRGTVLVGATLFSMFFGAGNLILPPLLGVQAASSTVPAMVGFFVTGVGLPVLGIVAVALAGTVRELADRVHPLFSRVFVAAVYLAIGPCLAIPRTSSTAFEMLVPLLPEGVSVEVVRLAFSIAFFAVAYALAMRPGRLTRLLGRITGPALIALIVAVVGSSIAALASAVALPDAAASAPYDSNAAVQGFLTGYQTMDLLASLTFGLVIATNIREMGVTEPRGVMREVCRAGVIAGALMMAIYGGLAAVGFELSSQLAGATNGAEVITVSATTHFGLDAILAFSVPLLNALYPVSIVLVVMGMLHGACDRVPLVWPLTTCFAGVVSVVCALRDAFAPGTWIPLDALPLADMGLGWVVPALIGALLGACLSLARSGRER